MKKILLILFYCVLLSGCATTVAIVDLAGATVDLAGATAVKAVKTTVKAVDAITPDIIEQHT